MFKTFYKIDGIGVHFNEKYKNPYMGLDTSNLTADNEYIRHPGYIKLLKGQLVVSSNDGPSGAIFSPIKDAYIVGYADDNLEGVYSFLIFCEFSNYPFLLEPNIAVTNPLLPTHRLCFSMPNGTSIYQFKQTEDSYTPNGEGSSPFAPSITTFINQSNNKIGRILSFFEQPNIGLYAYKYVAAFLLENVNLPLQIGAQHNGFWGQNNDGDFLDYLSPFMQSICTIQNASSKKAISSYNRITLSNTFEDYFKKQTIEPNFLQIASISAVSANEITIDAGDYSIMVQ